MESVLSAAVVIAGVASASIGVFFAAVALLLGFVALFIFWWREIRRPLGLKRLLENPVLAPLPLHGWESQAVFNPAALVAGGRVHILYRALGNDGISRIGYASSLDGIHFDERLPYPAYTPIKEFSMPGPDRRYGPLSYNTISYASGGGWGGSEDPRLVEMDGRVYMTFVAFDGWGFVRMALTSLPINNFLRKQWTWRMPALLSPPGEINKNWVLFPEKINGKYAILHSVSPEIAVAYVANLDDFDGTKFIYGSKRGGGRPGHWDSAVRGAGAPPIKTELGWLLLYHGFDADHPQIGYKVGAMLLDLHDPTKILYRSNGPILEAKEWYENDWKPGVTYASGAVIFKGDLIVYYGGGDKYVAAAKINLRDFLRKLTTHQHAQLQPVTL
jgi:predicted GH43/DUF377 family glycosyl hydrolase